MLKTSSGIHVSPIFGNVLYAWPWYVVAIAYKWTEHTSLHQKLMSGNWTASVKQHKIWCLIKRKKKMFCTTKVPGFYLKYISHWSERPHHEINHTMDIGVWVGVCEFESPCSNKQINKSHNHVQISFISDGPSHPTIEIKPIPATGFQSERIIQWKDFSFTMV